MAGLARRHRQVERRRRRRPGRHDQPGELHRARTPTPRSSSGASRWRRGLHRRDGTGAATQSDGEYFLDDVTIGKVDAATGSTKTATEYDLEPVGPSASIGDARTLEGNRQRHADLPGDAQRHRRS